MKLDAMVAGNGCDFGEVENRVRAISLFGKMEGNKSFAA